MPTAQLALHVLHATDVAVPPLDRANGMSVARWFSQASGSALDLLVQDPVAIELPRQCRAAVLSSAIRGALGTPSERPVGAIALVFAGRWATNRNLQGVMFDYDGTDALLGTFTSENGVPREGCAVFVDAIGDADPDQILFVAIHELGHVFNLQHDRAEDSFMATSTQKWGFSPDDCDHLAAAARGNWYYAPGGANFGPSDGPALWARRSRSGSHQSPLSLEASSARASYLCGELVVLDVSVTTTRGRTELPCELDPGYESLRIWIEASSGERWLFRPPHVYCRGRGGRISVATKRPLHHNPRVALSRCWSSPPAPGQYTLWVEYLLPPSHVGPRVLSSNPVQIEVRSPRNVEEEILCRVLVNPEILRFTSEKGGRLSHAARTALIAAIRRTPRHQATQHLRYALGTALLDDGSLRDASELLQGTRLAEPSLRRGRRRSLLRLARARSADRRKLGGVPHP